MYVYVSTETHAAIERIRIARGLRTLSSTVAQMAQDAERVAATATPHGPPAPDYAAVFDAWESIVGPGKRQTLAAALADGGGPRLVAAIRSAGFYVHSETAHAIGVVFRRLKGMVCGGRRLMSSSPGNVAARWYVERVGNGQAPGQAAAGAVAGQ